MIDSYKNIGITVEFSTKRMNATQLHKLYEPIKPQEHPNDNGNR